LQADLLLLLGGQLGRLAEGVATVPVRDALDVGGPFVRHAKERADGVWSVGQLGEQGAAFRFPGGFLRFPPAATSEHDPA
jgi:hypothetical protein